MISKIVVMHWGLHEGTDHVSCNVVVTDDVLGNVARDLHLSDAALCALRGGGVDDWNSAEVQAAVADHFAVALELVTPYEAPEEGEG